MWTTERWKKVTWSDESRFLLHHMDGWVRCLPEVHMAPGCTMERRQAGRRSVMLWAMFFWETLGPAIHVDVILTTKHCCRPCTPFHGSGTLKAVGCVLFQQDNQSNRASVGCAGQTSPIHGGPTSQLTGLKGSAANILVPDTTAHLQGSSGVYAWTGQGCFGSKSVTNTKLGRWSKCYS